MNADLLWPLVAVQIALGGFDTLFHHEFTERLAWRASQRHELQLHAVRKRHTPSVPDAGLAGGARRPGRWWCWGCSRPRSPSR